MFDTWIRKNLWKRAWQPTPVLLPGEFPWTEEPGRLQSMGSQRSRQDFHIQPPFCGRLIVLKLNFICIILLKSFNSFKFPITRSSTSWHATQQPSHLLCKLLSSLSYCDSSIITSAWPFISKYSYFLAFYFVFFIPHCRSLTSNWSWKCYI